MKYAIVAIVAVIAIIAILHWRSILCGTDVVDEFDIPHSPWSVRTEVSSCSAIDASMSVVALNKSTATRILLMQFGTPSNSRTIVASNGATVLVPKDADYKVLNEKFGPYRISVEQTDKLRIEPSAARR